VRALVPSATVLPPICHFAEPVAPMLAARAMSETIPTAPNCCGPTAGGDRALVIETFGSPFSPLNELELQVELVRRLDRPIGG